MALYAFDDEDMFLPHQGSDAESVSVNTRECMTYLIELVDPKEMLKDSLISEQKDLWQKMAFADAVINLFDMSTWSDVDCDPL